MSEAAAWAFLEETDIKIVRDKDTPLSDITTTELINYYFNSITTQTTLALTPWRRVSLEQLKQLRGTRIVV